MFSCFHRIRRAWRWLVVIPTSCLPVLAWSRPGDGAVAAEPTTPLVVANAWNGIGFGLALCLLIACLVLWVKARRERGRARRQRQEAERLQGELSSVAELIGRFAAGEKLEFDDSSETVGDAEDGGEEKGSEERTETRSTVGEISRNLQSASANLERVRAELKRAQGAKGDFLGSMSHEIRTPMNGILGTLNLLNDTGLSEDQRSLIDVMRSSSNSLMHLINDILDFSKLMSRMMALEKQPIKVRDLIDETVDLFGFIAAEKGVELCHYIDDSTPATIFADRQRLQQVLSSLVGNAVKFTYEGEVFASFTGREVITEKGARELILHCSVRDTGVGIAKENQERIFDAFTQADESSTRKHGGTGMGLAISRELCRLMGGDIGVESELWKGSHFTFELPFGGFADQDTESVKVRARRRKILEGKKFIVLCRQPTVASLLNHLCLRYGVEVVVASELSEHQMDGVIEMRPDAVIVDPGGQQQGQMDRFCDRLNRHGIPWVGLLSSTDRKPETSNLEEAKVDFCFKPITESGLIDTMANLLGGDEGYDAKDDPLSAEGARAFAKQHPARVMVVDDVEMNLKICTKILQSLGYAEVATATNGVEAMEVMKQQRPDVIFMDLQMPEMGGIEAAELIRANRDLSRQPIIIAITGHALSGVKQSCLEVGMDDFMTKPIEVGTLKDVVSRNYGKLINTAA